MTIPSETALHESTEHRREIDVNPFDGARVAITGGTSGLGLALVRELLRRGAREAFVARTRERIERVARDRKSVV